MKIKATDVESNYESYVLGSLVFGLMHFLNGHVVDNF